MDAAKAHPCPHCGSADTTTFEDGSGHCQACDGSFRGDTPVGAMIPGEEVEAGPKKIVARQKLRVGMLGVVGGVLGYLAVPSVFVVGALLSATGVEQHTADVFNQPQGALVCGGLVFLVIFGWYATWAGFHVWRGFPQRGKHLVAAGGLLAVSAALAGQGLPGIVGIVGGILALVGGLLAWRLVREDEGSESAAPPSAPA